LQFAMTPWKMRMSDMGTHMRVDRLADPKSNSPAFCEPQNVNWAPECLVRHFGAEIRESRQLPASSKLGVIGPLEVRLTRDRDPFDSKCDHLMVVDRSGRQLITGRLPVIGTYRLLRQDTAEKHGGFYSAQEFDISPLLTRHPGLRFVELGRSCVLPAYRTKRTIELLWHGVWRYVREHHLDVMIGCASFDGIDTARLARPLSFLHHFAPAPVPWRAAAHALRRVEMNRMAKSEITAWHDLPPLIKGYLRLGACVGDGAVIDRQFGTTDVLIILPISEISPRYVRHFGADAKRYAT
jgi:L-ornithine Nalpha-acyltransferase